MKKHEILSKYNLSRGAYQILINLGKIIKRSRYNNEITDEDFVKSFDYEAYKQAYHNSEDYKRMLSERNTKANQIRWSNASDKDRQKHKESCRLGTLKSQKEHPEQIEKMKESLRAYWSNEENRKAQSEKMINIYQNEETRQHIKDGCKQYWSNIEARITHSERMLKYWSEHPEKIAKMKETNRQSQLTLWDNDKKIRQSDITKSILFKIYSTKKQNNSFNISKPEKEILQLLQQKFNKVHYQYRSELYPFNCDFYIEDLDLYIECHFNWTHGSMPYDENNIDCINQLNEWKEKSKTSDFYQNAIYQWTDLDVRKRQCAIDNCLNWIAFYSYKEFEQWLNNLDI